MTTAPEVWLAGLDRIQKELKYSHKYELSNEDLVLYVVNNLGYKYDSQKMILKEVFP